MKKATLAFLVLLLALSLAATVGEGWGDDNKLLVADSAGVNYEYRLNERGEAIIEEERGSYLDESGTLMIPETLDGHPVTGIADYAFIYYSPFDLNVKKVVIPAGVTYIGANPFANWDKLETIEIDPDNERLEVVDGALYDVNEKHLICYPLSKEGNFTVNDGTRVIGAQAIGCDDWWAGWGSWLTEVLLPDSVEEIRAYAFAMSDIESITLPKSLKTIGDNAFEGTCLTKVVFNEGLESIGANAFAYTRLESVSLPDSLKSISKDAFACCEYLTEIDASERVKALLAVKPEDFMIYELDEDGCTTLTGFRFVPDDETLVIPETLDGQRVIGIGEDAFADVDEVNWLLEYPKRIELPASITEIVKNPFKNCVFSIEEIAVDPANECYESVGGVLYDKWEKILVACPMEKQTDYGTVTVKEGTCVIGEYAFGSESDHAATSKGKLTVVLPESLTEIRQGAFAKGYFYALEIPSGVKTLPPYAFADAHIEYLMLDEGLETIGYRAFEGCYGGRIILPPSVRTIEDEAFERGKFWDIQLSDGLKRIGRAAFANIYSLSEITLPDSLEYVAPDAFHKDYGAQVRINASDRILAMLEQNAS